MVLSPLLKKLMFVRKFDISKGKVELLDNREIMLDAGALLELQELDKSGLYEFGKESSLRRLKGYVDHAKVYKSMKDLFVEQVAALGKKIGQTDEGTLVTLQEIFNIYGLGELSIKDIDNENKQAIVTVKNSTIAEEYYKKNGKSKDPVCSLTAGIIAGMFSYIFGKEVDCAEDSCIAQRKGYCSFKIAP